MKTRTFLFAKSPHSGLPSSLASPQLGTLTRAEAA
jgi:hypothetical protein